MTDVNQPGTPPGIDERAAAFARQAEQPTPGVVAEFWGCLRHSKKWWLTPIILSLLLVGAIIVLGGTAIAPFIYTLF